MVDPDALNALIEDYLDKVDNNITAYGMDDRRGSEALDDIQSEVDSTTSRIRMNAPTSTVSGLRLDVHRSLDRVVGILCNLTNKSLSGLGLLPEARSISDNSVWVDTMSSVTGAISSVTDRFSSLLTNMDSNRSNQYDTNFSKIIEQGNSLMQRDNSNSSAESYKKWALSEIKKVEMNLTSLQNQSAAEMLQVLLQEKDAERLSLISQSKSLETGMSNANKSVVNTHNQKAMAILQEMAKNQTTYDASVRQRKFDLVDKHLANIERIVRGHTFGSNLEGGMFTSSKNIAGIHKRRSSNLTNFVPSRTYVQRAPPKNTRAGKLGNLGEEAVDSDDQGVFELEPTQLALGYGTRAVNTTLLLGGVALAGYLALGRREA
jgi:hypothetical protein